MAAPLGNQYAVGNNGGRPLEYTQEFIEKEAEAFLKWSKDPDNLYFKRFALERGYGPKMLSVFASRSIVFKEALEKASDWQEAKLVENSAKKKYDGNFCKFILIAKHDFPTDARPPEQSKGAFESHWKEQIEGNDGKVKEEKEVVK